MCGGSRTLLRAEQLIHLLDHSRVVLGRLVLLGLLMVCMIGMSPVSAAESQASESYSRPNEAYFAKYPLDIFYDPTKTEGYVIFPVYARAECLSYDTGWGWRRVPSVFRFDLYIYDVTSNAPENVFDLVDYDVLCTLYGTTISWSFTVGANIGFSKEPIEVGAGLEVSWTDSSTDIVSTSFSNAHWKSLGIHYHLGSITVDVNEKGKTDEKVACVFEVSVSNYYAQFYKYNHYRLLVKYTVTWQDWWMNLIAGSTSTTVYELYYLGDGTPGTDCWLYLLQASDYGGIAISDEY